METPATEGQTHLDTHSPLQPPASAFTLPATSQPLHPALLPSPLATLIFIPGVYPSVSGGGDLPVASCLLGGQGRGGRSVCTGLLGPLVLPAAPSLFSPSLDYSQSAEVASPLLHPHPPTPGVQVSEPGVTVWEPQNLLAPTPPQPSARPGHSAWLPKGQVLRGDGGRGTQGDLP